MILLKYRTNHAKKPRRRSTSQTESHWVWFRFLGVHLLDRVGGVHGPQFEHGGFGELAAVAGFPLVVLLDQDRTGQSSG